MGIEDRCFPLLRDHLGSVTYLMGNDNTVSEQWSYDSWGGFRDPTTLEPVKFPEYNAFERGFCGHEYLPEFGLINMNARLYDPMLGRFLSPDPYVQFPDATQSFNRYTYCANNPLLYTDPTGELFIIDDIVLGAAKALFKWNASYLKQPLNTIMIYAGLFALDTNKGPFGMGLDLLSRFTWQAPQTGFGLIAALGFNTFGHVRKVDYKYGATVVTTSNMKGGRAFTLGNFITGGRRLRADPNNSVFQHEYGHYLQSQSMGWAYTWRVGIPSLISAKFNKRHDYASFEMDANYRAFKYFNKNVKGFYKSERDWVLGHNQNKGWNFISNPLAKGGKYVDYEDKDQMRDIRRNLSISPNWYNYLIFPGPFEL